MKTIVAPSNLYITVLIDVGAYSNPSKFQKDSIYKSWDMPLLKSWFSYCIHFLHQGQHLNTAIENVRKTMSFKTSIS